MTLLSKACKSLLVFHGNFVSSTVSEIFSVKEWHNLETGDDFLFVRHCRQLYVVPFSSCLTLNNRDLEICVRGH